jgi:hypothetical protein
MTTIAPPPPLRSLLEDAEEQFGEEADHAGDDDRDHHQLDVAVADVGQLVAQHRLDLLIVQRVQQAGGDRD